MRLVSVTMAVPVTVSIAMVCLSAWGSVQHNDEDDDGQGEEGEEGEAGRGGEAGAGAGAGHFEVELRQEEEK